MKLQFKIEDDDAHILREVLENAIPTLSDTSQKEGAARVLKSLTTDLDLDTQIDLQVTNLLSNITGIPVNLIKNESKLGFHLGMGPSRIRALGGPLTLIAQKFKTTAQITLKEAEKLATVQDCIDVIKNKVS